MKIAIPKEAKELRQFVFVELSLVEPNSIEVDRLLPHLYESAIKHGWHGKFNKNFHGPDYTDTYLPELLKRNDLDGFGSARGREVIDNWLRASVVAFGRSGLSQRGEKMDYIRARTVAAYRAGFPDRRRSRQADTAIYAQMIKEIDRRKALGLLPGNVTSLRLMEEIVCASVGKDVHITEPPDWAPQPKAGQSIDISTLLALKFLEGFPQHNINPGKEKKTSVKRAAFFRENPAVPSAASPLGTDVVTYLVSYRDSTPLQAAQHLTAVLGLRLFQLTLRTSRAIRDLLASGEWPPDMTRSDAPNMLDQYIDFSGDSSSESREIARLCVQRDLRLTHSGLRDRLLLKTVRRALETSGLGAKDYDTWTGPERFKYLVEMAHNDELTPYYNMEIRTIRKENEDVEDEETKDYLARLESSGLSPLEELTGLLFEATRSRARHAALSWFRDTGGLNRSNGLLVGNSRRRETWAYAPGNDLVTALLGLAFTDDRGARRRQMLLSDLLSELASRFGLLIDRPPAEFDTVASRAAASANLDAFKRRLKLLGVFDALSDDFTAQVVLNPLLVGETS